jgi:hypothetical protein
MSLSTEQLSQLADLVLAAAPGDNPVPSIRAAFPGLAVSRCDASDMRDEAPFRRLGDYDVFLMNTSQHCWHLTDDPQSAGGIVLAKRH